MFAKFSLFLLVFILLFILITYLYDWCLTIWLLTSSLYYQNYELSSNFKWTSIEQFNHLESQFAPVILKQPKNWFVDAVNIGIDQLKQILESRGIYYRIYSNENEELTREKLIEIINAYGKVTQQELTDLNRLEKVNPNCDKNNFETSCQFDSNQVKLFSSGNLMDEEVEESRHKDVWLVYVKQNEHDKIGTANIFKLFTRIRKFGIRIAILDCNSDQLYCQRKRWTSSRFIFVTPEPKSDKFTRKSFYSYIIEPNFQTNNVLLWIHGHVSSYLTYIPDFETIGTKLNEFQKPQSNLVKMVTIMGNQLKHSPSLALALLALRFRERIQFGIYFASPEELQKLHIEFKTNIDPNLPVYLFLHGNQFHVYNQNNYEPLSYSQMEIYLRGMIPDSNDIHFALFLLLNLYLALNFFWTRCMTTSKHFRLCFIMVIESNIILLSTLIIYPLIFAKLISLVGLFSPHWFVPALQKQTIVLMQTIWSSSSVFLIRSNIYNSFSCDKFLLTFILTGILLALIRRKLFVKLRILNLVCNDYDDDLVKSVFNWASVIFCSIGFVLFRNTRRIRRRNVHSYNQSNSIDNLPLRNELITNSSNSSTHNDLNGNSSLDQGTTHEDFDNYDEESFDEFIDVDTDIDRLFMEQLFRLPGLFLHTELISTDYIQHLPIWQFSKPCIKRTTDIEEYNQCLSNNSSSTESSDNEQNFCAKDEIEMSTLASGNSNCCCNNQAASLDEELITSPSQQQCSAKASDNISKLDIRKDLTPRMKAKIAAKERKIIRMRRKLQRSNILKTNVKQLNNEAEKKEVKSDRPHWMLDFDDCTICLDAYKLSQMICGLPCGHNYHNDCIGQWLVRGNHCCPICRWPSYRFKHPRQKNTAKTVCT